MTCSLKELARGTDALVQRKRLLEEKLASVKEQAVVARRHAEELQLVRELLKFMVTANEQRVRNVFENVIGYGISSVFGEEMRFGVRIEAQKSGVKVEFSLVEGGSTESVPIPESFGGGLQELVAVLMRVLVLVMDRPRLRRFLVLDEPLSHLSERYQCRAAMLLRELCSRLSMTILLVSHERRIQAMADRLYRLERLGNSVEVMEETSAHEV
jgi:ABC-type glutathione transport system ATPase component